MRGDILHGKPGWEATGAVLLPTHLDLPARGLVFHPSLSHELLRRAVSPPVDLVILAGAAPAFLDLETPLDMGA